MGDVPRGRPTSTPLVERLVGRYPAAGGCIRAAWQSVTEEARAESSRHRDTFGQYLGRRGVPGDGDAAHAGGESPTDARDRVLEDQDVGRLDTEKLGTLEEALGVGLAPLDVVLGHQELDVVAGGAVAE